MHEFGEDTIQSIAVNQGSCLQQKAECQAANMEEELEFDKHQFAKSGLGKNQQWMLNT